MLKIDLVECWKVFNFLFVDRLQGCLSIILFFLLSSVMCFSPYEREPWFLNPGNFFLWNMESWALESGIHLKESGIPRTIGIQNPSSTDKHWFFTHKNDDFGAVSILTEWRWVARSCRRLIVIYRIGLCAILRGSVSRCLEQVGAAFSCQHDKPIRCSVIIA